MKVNPFCEDNAYFRQFLIIIFYYEKFQIYTKLDRPICHSYVLSLSFNNYQLMSDFNTDSHYSLKVFLE